MREKARECRTYSGLLHEKVFLRRTARTKRSRGGETRSYEDRWRVVSRLPKSEVEFTLLWTPVFGPLSVRAINPFEANIGPRESWEVGEGLVTERESCVSLWSEQAP